MLGLSDYPLSRPIPTAMPPIRHFSRVGLALKTTGHVRHGGAVQSVDLWTEDGEAYHFPLDRMDSGLFWRWAKREFGRFSGIVVGANLVANLDYLAEQGVSLPNVAGYCDVLVALALLDENRPSFTLDAAAKETGANHLLDIADRLQAALDAQELGPVYDLENRLIPPLLAMRRQGVRVDVSGAERLRERLLVERDAYLAEVQRLAGHSASLFDNRSLAAAIAERGFPLPPTPQTKQPSITKHWLEKYQYDPLVAAIGRGRRIDHLLRTFIDGVVLPHAIQGRLYPLYRQIKGEEGGTIARISCADPNVQAIPSRDEDLAPLARGLFLPEEGESWVRDDWSQIEYRLLAHFAVGQGAAEARRAYSEDPATDYHKLCAGFLGVDPEDKVRRKRVKTVNFLTVNSGGAAELARQTGMEIDEARAFFRTYHEALPFVRTTSDLAMRQAAEQGFVRTILRRRQRLNADMRYAALNRVLQGSAADLMKKSIVLMHEAGLRPPLVLVHDEFGHSANMRDSAHVSAMREAQHIMETAIPLRVPVIAEREIGPSWGEVA